MKKWSLSFWGYLVWGCLFLAWIIFLFSSAKEDTFKASAPALSWIVAVSPDEEQDDQNIIENSGFLSEIENDVSLEYLDSLGDLKEKIHTLEQLYSQQNTLEIANFLLHSYLLDNQFDKAKKFYISLSSSIKNQLEPDLAFKIGINAFSQTHETEYTNVKALLEQLHQKGIYSDIERKYYAVVFALVEKRYSDAQAGLSSLSWSKYNDFALAIQSAFSQYSALKDVPSYYQDALIAYQLMNQWFLAAAKKISLPLVNNYPQYVLPYQILANIDFLMGNWESASHYFSKLLELDYESKSLYLYHLGVSFYQLKKYSDAVLYLAQITDPSILLDSDRYLILSYLALSEDNRAFAGWQRLLGYTSIKKSDFYSFFEESLWKPYRLWKESIYYAKNPKLINDYLLSCQKKLKGDDLDVCMYGKIGLSLYSGDFLKRESQVLRFARRTSKSEFFQLASQIFLEKWNLKEATTALMRALALTSVPEERTYLKQQILKVNKLDN